MTQAKSSDKARNHALPRNYATILTAIRSAGVGTHLSALEVFTRARTAAPRLGFATVHRGLARLVELGHIAKLDLPGAVACVYEPARSPHAHFRCVACGAVHDVDFRVGAPELAELARRSGLRIDVQSTTFTGRCAACAADAREP